MYQKITHSTIPKGMMLMEGIERLSLQEVKELIGEVDVEKKARDIFEKHIGSNAELGYIPIKKEDVINAVKEALVVNKDKKYTEEDMRIAFFNGGNMKEIEEFNSFIQSLQPKTEWEVEFVDGKLKLLWLD